MGRSRQVRDRASGRYRRCPSSVVGRSPASIQSMSSVSINYNICQPVIASIISLATNFGTLDCVTYRLSKFSWHSPTALAFPFAFLCLSPLLLALVPGLRGTHPWELVRVAIPLASFALVLQPAVSLSMAGFETEGADMDLTTIHATMISI